MTEVILFTKPGCCLCDTVKTQLGKLRAAHNFKLEEVDILRDAEAYSKFHDEIPVVFVNGRKAFKYHLDEQAFLRRIESPPQYPEQAKHGS